MRTITTNVYQYHELTEAAKKKAREWYLRGFEFDNEFEAEDMLNAMHGLGFSAVRGDLVYSGINRQRLRGDGASFSATWNAEDFRRNVGTLLLERPPVCEANIELHAIARTIHDCAKRGLLESAIIRRFSRYCHDATMEADDGEGRLDELDVLLDAARRLARWYYARLQAAYDYQTSDEAIAEAIASNGYEFTAAGLPMLNV